MNEYNNIRGWVSIIFSGIGLGLLGGFLTLEYADSFLEHLIITSTIGSLLGIAVAFFINRRAPLEESWEPLHRSKDFDSYFQKEKNVKPSQNLIDQFPRFTDDELITALWFRYYELTALTAGKLIEEINRRSITERQIEELYNTKQFYKDIKPNQCPCCNNKEYLLKTEGVITNCNVCGFDLQVDNPKSIANRIRWSFGCYSNLKLPLEESKKRLITR